MLEVEEKIALVDAMTKKRRRADVDGNPVPVVGPHGDLYIVDHHHFFTVC